MSKRPTYIDKLKNPKWQKKRLEIFQRDNWSCVVCGETEKTLHIHHIEYISGNEPWDYKNSNFQTLCESCHKNTHTKEPIEINSNSLLNERKELLSNVTKIIANDFKTILAICIKDDCIIEDVAQLILNYENESIAASLYDYFSKEELNSNTYQASMRFKANQRVIRILGKQYFLHPDFKKLYSEFINDLIAENPFDEYILGEVLGTMIHLVNNSLKSILNDTINEFNNPSLETELVNNKMKYFMNLKYVALAVEKENKKKIQKLKNSS